MKDRRGLTLVAVLVGTVLLSLVGVYAIFDAIAAGPGRRSPELWEVPGGYRGLVIARFGVADCRPIPRRDGKPVYAVSPDGMFCSSDLLPEGFAVDAYEYVYPGGQRVTLRYGDEISKLVVRGNVEPDRSATLFIFVGTPDEQRRARDALPP